jgi:hypothetical protein
MVTDNWITPNKKNRFVPQSREKMTSTRALTGAKALAACEASVTLRATDDELARGVDVQMPQRPDGYSLHEASLCTVKNGARLAG